VSYIEFVSDCLTVFDIVNDHVEPLSSPAISRTVHDGHFEKGQSRYFRNPRDSIDPLIRAPNIAQNQIA
jgi:hypothetical protein